MVPPNLVFFEVVLAFPDESACQSLLKGPAGILIEIACNS